jgi:hypothetical protein
MNTETKSENEENKEKKKTEEILKKYSDKGKTYIGGDDMWGYYWNPGNFYTDGIKTWPKFGDNKKWQHIGYGRDRDMGSCDLFCNLETGKISGTFDYEGCLPKNVQTFTTMTIFSLENFLQKV